MGGIQTEPPTIIQRDAVTEVDAKVPDNAPQGNTEVVVIAYDGRKTAPEAFVVE